ncbi:MAG: sigma-70 family RNA polymerase sigma factor [Planctomycetes bacterium]|jgi:RNA polymerase sigma-70 factor (ECF subfamily)|nr:sigma-70 family RNA polymerase sigma factor [Planctomycetota bacterium]
MTPIPSLSRTPAAARPAAAAWNGLPGGLPAGVEALAGDAAMSDAELVRRTLAGQEDPFAALVARYQKRAFWIAYHVVGRVEDARDVAQESFVRLFRSLASYDFGRSFYTWFYRIVMNLAIDSLRKLRSSRASSLDDILGGLPDGREVEGERELEQREEGKAVWAVLDRLDAKFRAVLVLRDIHGLSCREIAPILRVTHATARWRLHRGRQMFRDHWERLQGRNEP